MNIDKIRIRITTIRIILAARYTRLKQKIVPKLFKWKFNKDFTKWARWQFDYVPYRTRFNSEEELFDSLLIIPKKYMHESGFACMDFISVIDGKPMYRLSGCSDVLHLDGILGGRVPSSEGSIPWCIDCLPCGILQLYSMGSRRCMSAGSALSSFELFYRGIRYKKGDYIKPNDISITIDQQ